MSVLQIEHLTKDYGSGRGVFDVTFNVEKGETFGFLGLNGSGKTTTIRHIMSFSKPQEGVTYVNNLALGAGIPIAFFIFQIMAQIGDSLSGFKYLTLNTLYNTIAIVNGGSYWLEFTVLTAIGIMLYAIGMERFIRKDLPL